MRQIMPGSEVRSNLFYAPDSTRPKAEAELDALCVYDSVLFLLEAKGKDLTAPARRGAPARLRDDLQKLVGESHIQALRARKYIESTPTAVFRDPKTEAQVCVPAERITEKFLVSVSLAPIGHLTASIHAESAPGLRLFERGEYSWIVGIYDLMVIADMIDLPPMFPHYVRRRVRAACGFRKFCPV